MTSFGWRLPVRLLQGHPAGADLEVDRRGADTDQRRTVVVAVLGDDSLAVEAVARRAADREELRPSAISSVSLRRRCPPTRAERGVQATGQHEPEQHNHETGERVPASGRQELSRSVPPRVDCYLSR